MEEFSFPSVAAELGTPLSFPRMATSPLWVPSSASFRNLRRRSFSSMEVPKRGDARFLSEVKDEERMDMLWEDLNDDLQVNVSCGGKGEEEKWSEVGDGFCDRRGPHQRPGLMVMLKVLKTLLLNTLILGVKYNKIASQ